LRKRRRIICTPNLPEHPHCTLPNDPCLTYSQNAPFTEWVLARLPGIRVTYAPDAMNNVQGLMYERSIHIENSISRPVSMIIRCGVQACLRPRIIVCSHLNIRVGHNSFLSGVCQQLCLDEWE
jgi:hypothetical protein